MTDQKCKLSRRKFLSTTALGSVSLSLASLPISLAKATENDNQDKTKSAPIIFRELGRTKMKLPIVSMGVMNANYPDIVRAAYDIGIRHFDTAAYYQFGRNEQMVGNVMKQIGKRETVQIATKVFHQRQRRQIEPENRKKELISAVEGCLKRLQMDYVDILFIHGVSSADDLKIEEYKEALGLLKKQGKIKATGVSTHTAMKDVLNEAASSGFYDVVLTSMNVSMADDQEFLQAVENAAKKGIGIIAMKTQAGGAQLPNREAMSKYSTSTINKASLKWVLRNKNISTAIPGFVTYEHMEENFSVAGNLEYTEEEKRFLSENNIKLSLGFCQQCGQCVASCPSRVDIPTLMRVHMYAAQYRNFHHAGATLKDIPIERSLTKCKSCNSCQARCVNQLNIPDRIETLQQIYV